MKKTYVKPNLNIEMFALSQTIAQSCGWTPGSTYGYPTHSGKATCGWDDGFGETYWTTVGPCGDEYPEDVEGAEICYNEPAGMPQIFAS